MAKYKLEYNNVEFRNEINPHQYHGVLLKRTCDDTLDFIASKHSAPKDSQLPINPNFSESRLLNIRRLACIIFCNEPDNREYTQDLIKLHDMIMHLIENTETVVDNDFSYNINHGKELNITLELEQEIDEIYAVATKQRFFPTLERVKEAKQNNTNSCSM